MPSLVYLRRSNLPGMAPTEDLYDQIRAFVLASGRRIRDRAGQLEDVGVAKLIENRPSSLGQSGDKLEREHFPRQFRQDRRLVSGTRSNFEDAFTSLET